MKLSGTILATAAVILSFIGGFLVANALNRSELEDLKKENGRISSLLAEAEKSEGELTLSKEEIQARIAEADSNPGNIKFNKDLGVALYRYGAMKKDVELLGQSTRLLERVLEKEPTDTDVLVSLGNAKFDIANFGTQKNLYADARELYRKALSVKPGDANVQTDIALTYFLTEPPDLERAEAEFEKALGMDPKNERALQFRIQALWQNGNTAKATEMLNRLKVVNGLNPAIPELTTLLTRTPPTK